MQFSLRKTRSCVKPSTNGCGPGLPLVYCGHVLQFVRRRSCMGGGGEVVDVTLHTSQPVSRPVSSDESRGRSLSSGGLRAGIPAAAWRGSTRPTGAVYHHQHDARAPQRPPHLVSRLLCLLQPLLPRTGGTHLLRQGTLVHHCLLTTPRKYLSE